MQCIECSACTKVTRKRYIPGKVMPYDDVRYMCYGVSEPFEIKDINRECTEYPEKKAKETLNDDRWFLNEIKEDDDCFEILNWYRNLYHTEPENTERGMMARAINDLFVKLNKE